MEFVFTLFIVLGAAYLVYDKKQKQIPNGRDDVPGRYRVSGKELRCAQCSSNQFKSREGLIATTWLAFVRLNAFNESATCFQCDECGHLHWFANPKSEKEEI